MPIGQCAPHRSVGAGAGLGEHARGDGAVQSLPSCDAAASASSSASIASASHAPVRQSGSACSGLIAERVKVTSSGSPARVRHAAASSTTATAAACHASTPSPRVTTAAA